MPDSDSMQASDWIKVAEHLTVASEEAAKALMYLAMHDFEGDYRTRLARLASELEEITQFALAKGLGPSQGIHGNGGQFQ